MNSAPTNLSVSRRSFVRGALAVARNDIVEFEKLLLSAGYKRDNVVVMHDDLKTLSHRRYLPLARTSAGNRRWAL